MVWSPRLERLTWQWLTKSSVVEYDGESQSLECTKQGRDVDGWEFIGYNLIILDRGSVRVGRAAAVSILAHRKAPTILKFHETEEGSDYAALE